MYQLKYIDESTRERSHEEIRFALEKGAEFIRFNIVTHEYMMKVAELSYLSVVKARIWDRRFEKQRHCELLNCWMQHDAPDIMHEEVYRIFCPARTT